MLQRIRDKISGWFAIAFLSVIAIVFIFGGVYLSDMTSAPYAAKVNGEQIPLDTVRNAWQQQQQRLQQTFRGEIPEPIAKAQQQAVLDQHIRKQLLTERANELGYRVTDSSLTQTITGFEALQVDGKFSRERYAALLRQQGRTEPQFERELRADLAIEQLQSGIASSAFVTPIEMARRHALQSEQREVDYALVPASVFLAAATVSDTEMQAWYDAHKAEYTTPETVDLEFVELKLTDVEQSIAVTEDALATYYEQIKERLTTPERRLGRHILFTTEDGKDDVAVQKTAAEVLAKLQAGGDFAALAKQYSKDPGSAEKGGDLGWATRGMFVGPFEEALFAMSKGELRGPIKTQFGYHILRLEDADGGQTKSFAEARAELEKDYRRDQAQTQFYDRSQKLADDAFSNLTDLASVAQTASVPLQKASGFTRQGGPPFGGEAKIIAAAFRPEAIEKGENSSLLSIGDDRAVIVRVAKHNPAAQLPLAAVRTQIEIRLKEQAARQAAAKRGAELLARLQGGAEWSAALSEFKLSSKGKRMLGRSETEVPAAVRDAAFKLPRANISTDKPLYQGTPTEAGDFAVLSVSNARTPPLENGTPETTAKIREARQAQGNDEVGAYVAEIERGAKIERNPKAFE